MITVQVGVEQVQVRPSMTLYELIHDFGIKVILPIRSRWAVSSCREAYLIGGHEVPHILFHHLSFYRQTLHIRSSGFSRENILECVAFAEVDFDEPGSQHHPLCTVLPDQHDTQEVSQVQTYLLVQEIKSVREIYS